VRRRVTTAAAAAAVLIIGLFSGASSASASTQPDHGCPAGAVCLYTNDPTGAKYLNGQPTYIFYSYGAHNISGAIGYGEYTDNQYGGANVGSYLCSGYNGTGTVLWQASGPANPGRGGVWTYSYVNLTPVNSVKLITTFGANQVGNGC
jgi:hypothetical protein